MVLEYSGVDASAAYLSYFSFVVYVVHDLRNWCLSINDLQIFKISSTSSQEIIGLYEDSLNQFKQVDSVKNSHYLDSSLYLVIINL